MSKLIKIYHSRHYGTSAFMDPDLPEDYRLVWQGPTRNNIRPGWFGWMIGTPSIYEKEFIDCPKWWT